MVARYQAAWTARVLTGLTERWGAGFSANLRLVSAVSAGAVGSMHFSMPTLPTVRRAEISEKCWRNRRCGSRRPATSGGGWRISTSRACCCRCASNAIGGGHWNRHGVERCARLRTLAGESRTEMTSGRTGVAAGWRPASAFNAMAVETGERVVLATYALPRGSGAHLARAHRQSRYRRRDGRPALGLFPVHHAVRAGRRQALEDDCTIADGGYWDNHAIVSALEWLTATEEHVERATSS